MEKTHAKDFFLHIAVIIFLYLSVISFLQIIFNIVDYIFPSEIYNTYINVSWQTAALTISIPLTIIFMSIIYSEYKKHPEKKSLKIREWLVYLTLFVAVITFAIDLITLFYYFFDGREITTRFLIKIISVMLVSASVFFYFIYDIKDKITPKIKKIVAFTLIFITAITIIVVFSIVGTPEQQRKKRIDEQKIFELMSLQNSISYFWETKNKLPESLDELKKENIYYLPINYQYEYNVLNSTSFEICTTFYYSNTNSEWSHTDGRYCFVRDVSNLIPKR